MFTLIEIMGMLATGVVVTLFLSRIIAKIILRTFYQEKEKYNGKISSGNPQRKVKK